jgi:alanine racemase
MGDTHVEVGDEVVLLGRDGDAEITADEWADRLGTIAYEIVCGIGRRVPRSYG